MFDTGADSLFDVPFLPMLSVLEPFVHYLFGMLYSEYIFVSVWADEKGIALVVLDYGIVWLHSVFKYVSPSLDMIEPV